MIRAQLEQIDSEWAATAAAGRDVDRIVSFWTDDAVVIPPGQPAIIGKESIRNYVANSLKVPGFHISWRTEQFKVSDSGDLAYGVGTNQVSSSGKDGKLVTSNGRGVTIWRVETGGSWKCVVDIWNEDVASG